MKFRMGKRSKVALSGDKSEGMGLKHHVPEQKVSKSPLSGLIHELMFKRVSISIILLMILIASGALIMLLNHLLAG